MSSGTAESPPLLFISHKHVDSAIADVVRTFVTMQSGGRVSVFQSSSPWADAPKAGRNLNKQLRETLWRSSVVILIYTTEDRDWSYCMWECGVASHPQSPDSKIILFQCTGHSPALFADQVNVNVRDLVSIQQFVDDFLTSSDFFPGSPGPITRFQAHGREVANAAADLFQKLQAVLPPEREDPSSEWPSAPFLQLELPFEQVERISKAPSKDRSRLAQRTLLKESIVTVADKYCEQMFGVPSFAEGTTLEQIVAIWKTRHADTDAKWVKALCGQLLAGALWQFPPMTWELMQGVGDEAWRAPMMTRVRKLPQRGCIQFDIYFFPFPVKAGAEAVQIEVPKPVGREPRTARKGPQAKKEPARSGKRARPS